MKRIAILITCHNRETLTLRCIRSLSKTNNKQKYELDFFVVNDGCTDDTESLIKKEFPTVQILEGDGSLYWNGGMHLAFKTAKSIGFDFYLWVNDDVEFYDYAIPQMMRVYESLQDEMAIVTGYTYDRDEKTITYGGQRIKRGIIPLNLKNFFPEGNKIERCDTMHGNCVLIPNCVTEVIGINDSFYTHGFGDIDYGLTATMNNIPIYLTDFAVGICEKNPLSNRSNTFKDKGLVERFRTMNSYKHRPVKDWLYFTKKFGGPLWFLRFIAPYIKLALNIYK